MPQERASILIDGSNFYFKLRDLNLHQFLTFNFSQFATSLIGNRALVQATYYVGAVRTDGTAKTQQLFNHQRKLFAHLRKHSFTYSLGYLLKDKKGVFHEKGVDVNIAVDMLVATYENLCDRLILVSSDTDLLLIASLLSSVIILESCGLKSSILFRHDVVDLFSCLNNVT